MNTLDDDEDVLLFANDGIPALIRDERLPHEKQKAVYFVLISTFFERIAFFAFFNTLFVALQLEDPFRWDNQHSKTASYIFAGISYISTFPFAIISDWKLGRAKTITIGFVLYLFGMIIITITSSGNTALCRSHQIHYGNITSIINEPCGATVISTLIFTALGVGAIKSNLVILGAEQNQDPRSRQSSRYFDQYAFFVNFGSIIGIAITSYLHDILTAQHHYISYLFAVVMVFMAVLFFLIGWRYYLHVPSNETVIFRCIPVLINACRSWYIFKRNRHPINQREMNTTLASNTYNSSVEIEESIIRRKTSSSILDFAKQSHGGKFHNRHVREVKAVRSGLLVFILLIPFWLAYNQVGASFQSQAEHMRRPSGNFIVSFTSLGDPIVVVIGILILNGIVYRYMDVRHKSLLISKKLFMGMCFAAASMFTAGIVEIIRQNECPNNKMLNRNLNYQNNFNNVSNMTDSQLSIYAQIPQSVLIGFSQLFGMIGGYEYAFFAAPRSGQSLFMSFYFCSIGMSYLIGTIYLNLFPQPDIYIDFQCGKNDGWYWSFYTYFFNIAGLQLIVIIIFIICCIKYGLVQLNRQQLQENQFDD